MIAISEEVKKEIEERLAEVEAGSGALIPLTSMDRHYCSLEEKKDDAAYLHLMTLDTTSGRKAFIYFKT